jgi:nucleoside-diphosphate-sugar epimerase
VRVLVTGATGLVGFELIEALRTAGAAKVVGISRSRSSASGETVAWDMAAEPAPASLRQGWDAIVHAAADTRWTMNPDEAVKANVDTVHALEPLVADETHLVHVSTAYSVGLRGDIESTDLADYRNSYEWSKAHAERIVRTRFPQYTIVRPPLIVGRSGDGRAARFAGMYTLLRAMSASMVPVVVAAPDAFLDVVPVDAVAKVLVDTALSEGNGETLTVAAGRWAPRVEVAVELMTDALNRWRVERELEPLDAPRLVSRESWERFFLPFVRDQLSPRQRSILELLSNFEPYLAIHEPLAITHRADEIEAAISASVRYWADREPRRASLAPRPWTAVTR